MATVREEYFTLARDFRALAAQFGLAVDGALETDLLTLMAAFEAIDRHVDALATADERARLAGEIVGALDGAGERELDGELGARLAGLRAILSRDGAAFVAGSLARFFVHSEELRSTTDPSRYLRAVLDEAARASEMTLEVARFDDPRFVRFFAVLSEVANLVDKLHDVRGDRRRGEIAVDAGARLHALLAGAFATRAATLLRLSPRPLRLVAWGARYLLPPKGA